MLGEIVVVLGLGVWLVPRPSCATRSSHWPWQS
jgi:hypothetical protein